MVDLLLLCFDDISAQSTSVMRIIWMLWVMQNDTVQPSSRASLDSSLHVTTSASVRVRPASLRDLTVTEDPCEDAPPAPSESASEASSAWAAVSASGTAADGATPSAAAQPRRKKNVFKRIFRLNGSRGDLPEEASRLTDASGAELNTAPPAAAEASDVPSTVQLRLPKSPAVPRCSVCHTELTVEERAAEQESRDWGMPQQAAAVARATVCHSCSRLSFAAQTSIACATTPQYPWCRCGERTVSA